MFSRVCWSFCDPGPFKPHAIVCSRTLRRRSVASISPNDARGLEYQEVLTARYPTPFLTRLGPPDRRYFATPVDPTSIQPPQPTKLLKVLSGVSAKSIQRRLIFAASVVSTVETSFDFGCQNSLIGHRGRGMGHRAAGRRYIPTAMEESRSDK